MDTPGRGAAGQRQGDLKEDTRLTRWTPFSRDNIGFKEMNELQSPTIWV